MKSDGNAPEIGSPEWLKQIYGWASDTSAIYDIQCPGRTEADFYQHEETILLLLDPQPHEVGLNLGCGCGRAEFQWAARVKEFHGVDFSEPAVARARQHCPPNTKFFVNDGQNLPLADATYDFAMCETTFQHVPKNITLGYIKELHRVLKPGGRLALQIPRLDMYGNDPTCGGMARDEVEGALSIFSAFDFPVQAAKQCFYHVPVCIK